MKRLVARSFTCHSVIMMVLAPAILNARCRPNTPSPDISPNPVSQADITTISVFRKSSTEISLAVKIPSSTPCGNRSLCPESAVLAPANSRPHRSNGSIGRACSTSFSPESFIVTGNDNSDGFYDWLERFEESEDKKKVEMFVKGN